MTNTTPARGATHRKLKPSTTTHPARRRAAKIDQAASKRLSLYRRANSLTQTQLADHLGVSFQQIQKYETGQSRMKLGTALVLTEVLGIALTDFVATDAERMETDGLLYNFVRLNRSNRALIEHIVKSMLSEGE